mmetsp:Transcript_103506/g.309229  ORF Transcript_103506/g.309229 Transcript_103506/m.309229 type:complete len:306 (+) Transcript_103506:60-977(+)
MRGGMHGRTKANRQTGKQESRHAGMHESLLCRSGMQLGLDRIGRLTPIRRHAVRSWYASCRTHSTRRRHSVGPRHARHAWCSRLAQGHHLDSFACWWHHHSGGRLAHEAYNHCRIEQQDDLNSRQVQADFPLVVVAADLLDEGNGEVPDDLLEGLHQVQFSNRRHYPADPHHHTNDPQNCIEAEQNHGPLERLPCGLHVLGHRTPQASRERRHEAQAHGYDIPDLDDRAARHEGAEVLADLGHRVGELRVVLHLIAHEGARLEPPLQLQWTNAARRPRNCKCGDRVQYGLQNACENNAAADQLLG